MRSRFAGLGLLLALLFAADLLVGAQGWLWALDGGGGFGGQEDIARRILFDFRLPKALTAVLAGVALSTSGLLMQTVFRNPLAGPYVLGVSSGASLGVAIFLMGGVGLGMGLGTGLARDLGSAVAAWVGAAGILVLVMAVAARIKDIMAVLILGMMFGSVAAAGVGILQYFSHETALKGFILWSMGSLGGLSAGQLLILGGCTLAGLALATVSVKALNLLLLGEGYARTMGVDIRLTRGLVFGATSLLAGGVTAFCGPIGFVGIAVPHIARMCFRRADHRVLLPASALVGADLMLVCDLISQLPGMGIVLPISTITALLGIPVVILVVVQSKRGRIM